MVSPDFTHEFLFRLDQHISSIAGINDGFLKDIHVKIASLVDEQSKSKLGDYTNVLKKSLDKNKELLSQRYTISSTQESEKIEKDGKLISQRKLSTKNQRKILDLMNEYVSHLSFGERFFSTVTSVDQVTLKRIQEEKLSLANQEY